MKALIFLSAIISSLAYGQDSLRYRIIIAGDNSSAVLRSVSDKILEQKTMVFYLGENKFLGGRTKNGSKEEREAQSQLRSHYELLSAKGAGVYFVSAGRDWNSVSLEGAGKKNTKASADSLFKRSPVNNCPDPVAIKLTDELTAIVFNSQWWLYPAGIPAIDDSCTCKTRSEVLASLDELRYENQDKMVLLVSQHPFQSYGVHGSKGNLNDHLFPLTAANKNLYIPLPVIGSVYRFVRSGFASSDNIRHPVYKDMIATVGDVFADFPNLTHIAGDENGLQFIKEKFVQVVSGPGAKNIKARKGKNSLFADNHPGFVVVDFYGDKSLRFHYFIPEKNGKPAFDYTLGYTSPPSIDYTLSENNIRGDSITVMVHPSYDSVGRFRRRFFGENYRKEWALPVRLPVIRVSEIDGGLTPLKRGGGMQSKSLRLAGKDGKEWVIRSVEKSVDALLPENLQRTFAYDWLDDATSAQYPFGALVVPPIANAVKVPHANPVIGVVAQDKNLGYHGRIFANMVAVVEEREPLGDSDNSAKMKKNLQADNDNRIIAKEFLNARMLDMLLGDWDRHEDQWRWKDQAKGKTKNYLGVPRDRDQVFHLTEGYVPKMASRDYVLPTLRNFDPDIEKVKWVLYKSQFVNAYPEFQFSHNEWMKEAENFKKAVTDSVLDKALKQLPKSAYDLRYDELMKKLQSRRDRIPVAMDKYYRFIQKIVDIQTSDKSELVEVTDASNGGLNVRIFKLSKGRKVEDELMNKNYDPALTEEVRIYVRDGQDSIVVNTNTSRIRVRIIGGNDQKAYNIIASGKKIKVYDKENGSVFYGDASRVKKTLSNDTINTAYVPVNLYNTWMPLVAVGLNIDDGFIIGAGFKFTKQEGFRKLPFAHTQQLQVRYAFATGAYRVNYDGEWLRTFGNADLVVQLVAKAPNNTVNFFGVGNETEYDKTGDHKRYYRTRYSTFQADPAIRWHIKRGNISVGPSLYYYTYDEEDNEGRFITNTSEIGSYDSATLEKSKLHLGIALQYTRDSRSSPVIPRWGSYINVRIQGYKGVGSYARSFAQIIPEIAFYRSLSRSSAFVIAERLGGVVSIGDLAFYQSAFIGGHENLFGYRQYRFAGQHSIYNNLELRVKLADIASYIIPGQFGISGFWDIGRVWVKHDNSGKWHNGVGGGIYFAPASIIAFSFVMGYSTEGWYPYFSMGLRF